MQEQRPRNDKARRWRAAGFWTTTDISGAFAFLSAPSIAYKKTKIKYYYQGGGR